MDTMRERLWEAYLDGELSAGEAAQFESTLTEEEHRHIALDKRFERALAVRLIEGGECPARVWAQTCAQLRRHASVPTSRMRRVYWGAASLAAAAAVAFVLSLATVNLQTPDEHGAVFAALSVDDMVSTSDVAPGHDHAAQYLKDKGIDLDMFRESSLEIASGHHGPIEIVGARQESLSGDDVTEVLFACCGYPVKVLLAKRESAAAQAIGRASGEDSDIQATRVIGDYLTAVVSDHPAHGMLDIFVGQDR